MEKTTAKSLGIAIWVFLILGVAMIFYLRQKFMKDYKFTSGTVTEITGPGYHSTGDYSILYEYWVNDKIYRNNENYNYCTGWSMSRVKLLLVGKQFPVAYSASNPGVCTMLLTQENAERFKFQLPDSVIYYDSVLTCKQ